MSAEQSAPSGPDLRQGIRFDEIPDGGMIGGHADGQAGHLARQGDDVFAIGGQCTHYGGPLAEGLMVGNTVRCPWHHACFDLRTGEALAAPALNPVSRWEIVRDGATVRVSNEIAARTVRRRLEPASLAKQPGSVVIVGAGAAGNAAAEMLRREGYDGTLTMIGGDESVPYDRPESLEGLSRGKCA